MGVMVKSGAGLEGMMIGSAGSALSQLDEPEIALQSHALRLLDALADGFWPEISPSLSKIQALSSDGDFPDAKLAGLVAAKVLFHLGELDEALEYALSAGDCFDVSASSEFSRTLRGRCIDEYIAIRSGHTKDEEGAKATYVGLEPVVERILDECVAKGEVQEVLGVALEARRLDRVEDTITSGCKSSEERIAALNYCFRCAQTLVASRSYREEVLRLVAELHRREDHPDQVAVALCLAFIGDDQGVAEILVDLVQSDANETAEEDLRELIALQIAFDIYDNDTPRFASAIVSRLPEPAPKEENKPEPDACTKRTEEKIAKIKDILSGSKPASLVLEFLLSSSQTDSHILRNIKASLDGRSSVGHTGLVFTNSLMYCGTAVDSFLRENLDWLGRATCWAKFSATACLGLIHARHTRNALMQLQPYLSDHDSPYSEGGAYYALGLIVAAGGNVNEVLPSNVDGDVPTTAPQYLHLSLTWANESQVIRHGLCLGLGLACMASWNGEGQETNVYESLKTTLFSENAVAGEAAGLGLGLVALGSGSARVVDEMLAYAHETQHEKITRGLAMGVALVCYAREEDADETIQTLLNDKDQILRYGAMYAVALAYCGTANNRAVRLLLRTAVSDVSDDVRRAAVIALGFVMMRHPKQIPRIVSLLSESCHAHVRYGAAMAIGVACCGTGQLSTLDILERLAADPSDFVRQGALISLALVFVQQSEAKVPKVAEIRRQFERTIADKHEEVMTKFGAVLASGIIDAGGRNCIFGLTSHSGHRRMSAIVGMAMFTQFWYWFPLVPFLGLALRPAMFMGLTKDLKMPVMEIKSDIRSSLFAYPPRGPPEKSKEVSKAPVAVLSVTAKANARQSRKARKDQTKGEDPTNQVSAMDVDKDKAEKQTEAPFSILKNPCRVLPDQERFIQILPDSRYTPIKKGAVSGFLMLHDSRRGEEETFVEVSSMNSQVPSPAPALAPPTSTTTQGADPTVAPAATEEEPGPPEPFIYEDDSQKPDESHRDQ